jgi:acetyl esterase/lipase
VHLHDTFWLTEAAHEDASPPAMLKRGEKCELPPALVFGGDKDEWVPVELMRSFVADYNKAGGNAELRLYEGANHGFMTGKPDAPYRPGDRADEAVHPQAHHGLSAMQQNRVKKIPREGGLALGTHVGGIPGPQIVELIGLAGFDAAFCCCVFH